MRLELPKHVVAMVHGIRSGGLADESRERPTRATQTSKAAEAPLSTAGFADGSGREREKLKFGEAEVKKEKRKGRNREARGLPVCQNYEPLD